MDTSSAKNSCFFEHEGDLALRQHQDSQTGTAQCPDQLLVHLADRGRILNVLLASSVTGRSASRSAVADWAAVAAEEVQRRRKATGRQPGGTRP